MEEAIDVAVQCRACLSTTSSEYIDMESSMAGEYSYLECFNICTNLKASIEDQLPVIICSICSHDLQIAFDFLQVARQADEVLRQNHYVKFKVEQYEEEGEVERLEYIDGEDETIEAVNEEEEQVFELEMEDNVGEVHEMELITHEYDVGEQQYREGGFVNEIEFVEEKPHVESFLVEVQDTTTEVTSNKSSGMKEHRETQESFPEDEIDDEYLIEHNPSAEDQAAQGWKCFECKRMLHADVSYEGHLNMHRNLKPYKCTHCRSTFRCRNALEHHASKRHEQGKSAQKCFTCDICDKPFRLATLLLEHRRSEHKTLVSCSKCTKSFKSQELLDEHMTLIHPPTNTTPIQCPYCTHPPITKARIVDHLRSQHPAEHRKHLHTVGRPCDENKVTPWQCEECFRYYRTEALLKDHSNTHTNERPHSCSVCEKRFFTANNLRSHMRSIHQAEYEKRLAESLDAVVKCEICKKKLLQKNLEKHMLTHERKEKQADGGAGGVGSTAKYLCAYCPKAFNNQAKLSKHEEVHNPDRTRNFACDYCNSKFYTNYDMSHHVRRVHQGTERAYVCFVCGNAFKEKSQLQNHIKLHTQKNIQCQLCDKKYARQIDFQVHMRSHTGELPYACHLCDKRFAIKVRLTYHLQKHLGIKHECNICGSIYNSRGKLRMHMFKHNGMPYRCEECPSAQFSKRERFRLHISRVHNRTPSEEELTANFERNTGKAIHIKEVPPDVTL